MKDIVQRYLPRLHQVATERLIRVLSLLAEAQDNADQIASEFHTLAGEAGLLGLMEISTHARTGEAAARALSQDRSQVVTCAKVVRRIRKLLQVLIAMPPLAPTASPTAAPAHVMVVDDSELVSGQLCDALQDAGLRTSAASDHKSATAMARKTHPAVVLIDVMMECGDVRELCPALRDVCGPHTSLLLVSGMAEEALAELALEVGATGFVAKKRGLEGIVERTLAMLQQVRL